MELYTCLTGVVTCSRLTPTRLGQNDMYALDAETGNILWGFNSGGSVNAGAAVVGDRATVASA